MAAVTGAAIAVAGLGLSAAQAIKSSQDMKTANNAAKAAQNELSKISETNAFKQVQVPTLGLDLAQQSQAQRTASALSAVQSAGAEGETLRADWQSAVHRILEPAASQRCPARMDHAGDPATPCGGGASRAILL